MILLDALPDARHLLLGLSAPSDAALFVVAVLLASGLVAIGVMALDRRRASKAKGAPSERNPYLVVLLLALALIGVALLTPSRTLPGPHPEPGMWLFLPAVPTYQALAVLVHALVALIGVIVAWIGPVVFAVMRVGGSVPGELMSWRSAVVATPTFLSITAFLVIAWELAGWPSWFLIASEFGFAYLACLVLSNAPRMLWNNRPLGSVRWRRRYWHATTLFRDGLAFVLFVVILAAHPQPATIVAVLGLVLTLCLLDSIAAAGAGFGKMLAGEPLIILARRWLITVPLALGVTALGVLVASGMFGNLDFLGALGRYPASLWLNAGSAAAVYLFATPFIFTSPRPATPATPATPASTAAPEQPSEESGEPEGRKGRKGRSGGRARRHWRVRSLALVVAGLIAYEVATAQTSLASAFRSGVAPLGVGAVAVLATLSVLLRRGPRRGRMLALLAALLVGMAAVALIAVLPGQSASLVEMALVAVGLAAPAGGQTMALGVASEVVVLLALYAVAYSLDRIATPRGLTGPAADANEYITLGHIWLRSAPEDAPTRYQQATLRAIDAFQTATRLDADSVFAWSSDANALYRMGNILADAGDTAGGLEQFQQALAAYARLQELAPHDALTLTNHAEALRQVARLQQEQARELGQQIRERFSVLERRHESMTAVDGTPVHNSPASIRRLRADAVNRLGALTRTLAEVEEEYQGADDLCERALDLLAQPAAPPPPNAGWMERLRESTYGEERRQQTRQFTLLTRGRILFDWAQAHLTVPGQVADPTAEAEHLEERALAAMQAALEISPSVQALNIKGILLQRQGNPRQAAATFEEAMRVSGNANAVVAYNLGNAWEDAGEWEKAQAAYEQALAQRPAYPEARAGRDRMRSRLSIVPPRPEKGTGNDTSADREPHEGPAGPAS